MPTLADSVLAGIVECAKTSILTGLRVRDEDATGLWIAEVVGASVVVAAGDRPNHSHATDSLVAGVDTVAEVAVVTLDVSTFADASAAEVALGAGTLVVARQCVERVAAGVVQVLELRGLELRVADIVSAEVCVIAVGRSFDEHTALRVDAGFAAVAGVFVFADDWLTLALELAADVFFRAGTAVVAGRGVRNEDAA